MLASFFEEHWNDKDGNPTGGVSSGRGVVISWQNGPLGKVPNRKAPNGAFVESVIAMARNRIEFYQGSKFECSDNAEAIFHLNKALLALDGRTKRREASGIEGTHAEDGVK